MKMFNNLSIKKISMWLSVITLTCFAIAVLLFFQIDVKNFNDNKYQYDVNEEKIFSTEGIKDINISSSLSDINIIEYDDTKVKVHIYGKLYTEKKVEENKPVIELADGRLDIKENRNSGIHLGINFNIGELFNRNEMKIDLYVPKSYRENMKIDSSSGNVKADFLNLKEFALKTFSGDIKLDDVTADTANIETSSGNINAGNIQANDFKLKTFSGDSGFKSINAQKATIGSSSGNSSLGTVKAKKFTCTTFSGNIGAAGIDSEDAYVSSSSGNISLRGLAGSMSVKTFSGDVSAEYMQYPNNVTAKTSSGNITIKLPEGSEFSLEADSSSGDVSCDFPISIEGKHSDHKIRGVVGKDTYKIKVNTFSGNIRVRK
jgi:lia operon protein LiaG